MNEGERENSSLIMNDFMAINCKLNTSLHIGFSQKFLKSSHPIFFFVGFSNYVIYIYLRKVQKFLRHIPSSAPFTCIF